MSWWDEYLANHTTFGCRVTHIVGIPLITIALPLLWIDWRCALWVVMNGMLLLCIGHWYFERNEPVVVQWFRKMWKH